MNMIKFYRNVVLPWRQRAELAEIRLVHMSTLVNKMSHKLAEEIERKRKP